MKLGGYRGNEAFGRVEAGDGQNALYKIFLHNKKYSYHFSTQTNNIPILK